LTARYTTVGFGMSTRVVAETQAFTPLPVVKLLNSWRRATRRIVVLDFDSLVERDSEVWRSLAQQEQGGASRRVPLAKQQRLPKHATAALAALSSNARNTIFVVSSYTRAQLDPVLGAIPGLGIAAEHGFHFRYAKSTAAAARSAFAAGGAKVSFLFTITFHANRAYNLTRSP
jgi:trehalose 6-phosphate synthase/phosphatase